MTLVNVSSPLKQDDIQKVLEANENPKYTFVKKLTPIERQYEAVYAEGTDGNPADAAKKIIRSQPWGGVLNIRVLIDGQKFTGGKV